MNLKKFLAGTAALVACTAIIPDNLVKEVATRVFAFDETYYTYDIFTYQIEDRVIYGEENENVKVVAITHIADSASGDIVIPDEIDGMEVRRVSFGSLYNRNDVTSVTIPKYIEEFDFWEWYDIPGDCEIKLSEGCLNYEIENGMVIQKEYAYYDYDTQKSITGKVAVLAAKHLSGEVTVPEGVLFASGLFAGNPDITVINLPSSIINLEWYFCSDMPSLTAINVDEKNETYFSYHGALGKYKTEHNGHWDGTEWIDDGETKIKEIVAVPEGMEGEFVTDDADKLRIGGESFVGVSKLKSVKLGKNTSFTPFFAGFGRCASLENIEIDFTCNTLYPYMFDSTKWYEDQPDGVLYVGTNLIGYKGTPKEGEVINVKEGTTSISDRSFFETAISEVNIPASVEYIGTYAFDGPNVKAVNVDVYNKNYASDNGVVYDRDMKILKFYPRGKTDEVYNIKKGTEIIAVDAFALNPYIKHVNIPDSVYWVVGYSFLRCTSLEEFTFPDKVKEVGYSELSECDLKYVDLGENVELYGKWEGCGAKFERIIIRNPECEINDLGNTIIVGHKDSTAQAYAELNGLEFETIEEWTAKNPKEPAVTTTTAATTATTTTTTAITTTTTAVAEETTTTTESATTTTSSTASQPAETTTTTTTASEEPDTPVTTTTASDGGESDKTVSYGDPSGDGKIDAKDASFVLIEYSKLATGAESKLSDEEKAAADVNKDGKTDAKDASLILAFYGHISTGGKDSFEDFVKARI